MNADNKFFSFNRMKWSYMLFTMVLALLTGCTSSTSNNPLSAYPDDISRFAIVSISAPGFKLLATDSFAFHPNLSSTGLNKQAALPEARQLIEASIEQSFTDRGLDFNPYVRASSDFWVAYEIVLDETLGDDEVMQKYGMMAGFISSPTTRYEKGSLIVDLVDASSQRAVWRGSVQGLVAPDLPQEVRRLRLQSAIDQMLNSLPLASQ